MVALQNELGVIITIAHSLPNDVKGYVLGIPAGHLKLKIYQNSVACDALGLSFARIAYVAMSQGPPRYDACAECPASLSEANLLTSSNIQSPLPEERCSLLEQSNILRDG